MKFPRASRRIANFETSFSLPIFFSGPQFITVRLNPSTPYQLLLLLRLTRFSQPPQLLPSPFPLPSLLPSLVQRSTANIHRVSLLALIYGL